MKSADRGVPLITWLHVPRCMDDREDIDLIGLYVVNDAVRPLHHFPNLLRFRLRNDEPR